MCVQNTGLFLSFFHKLQPVRQKSQMGYSVAGWLYGTTEVWLRAMVGWWWCIPPYHTTTTICTAPQHSTVATRVCGDALLPSNLWEVSVVQ
jgi:hypothetical protein